MGVVAPENKTPPMTCPLVRGDEHSPNDFWWFTDNKAILTDRDNWTPEMLNKLLERAVYCSEYNSNYVVSDVEIGVERVIWQS